MPLAYTIISGLSVVLVFASFRSHWRTENYAACILIIWVAVNNLFYCINSIIWPDFETIHEKWDGRIYCDIMSRISICVNAGVLGSLAAISRNLAKIISDRSTAAFSRSEKRKNLAIDLALCFALPIWYNLVYYFVQYARYWLIPVSGCVAVLDSSWLATILIFVPGLIMTLTTLYFSLLVLWRMKKYRREFSAILKNSRSQTSKSRFIRLFLIAFILSTLFCTVNLWENILNFEGHPGPYSFSRTHHSPSWSYVARLPEPKGYVVIRWSGVLGVMIMFFFFLIGTDAVLFYKKLAKKTGADAYLPVWCCGARIKTKTSATASSSGSNWTIKNYFKGRKQTSTISSHASNTLHSQHSSQQSDGKAIIGEILPVAEIATNSSGHTGTRPTIFSKIKGLFTPKMPFTKTAHKQTNSVNEILDNDTDNGKDLSKIHVSRNFEVTNNTKTAPKTHAHEQQTSKQSPRTSDEIPLESIITLREGLDLESQGSETTQVVTRT